jgi:hypothetical protein
MVTSEDGYAARKICIGRQPGEASLIDRRGYAAILAIALAWAARGPSAGEEVASSVVTSGAAPRASAWQEQSAAGQASAATQSSGKEPGAIPPAAGSAMHSITVQFDYDFTRTPACSAKVTISCVQKFNVYDISGEKPYLLFSVPVPANALGLMKGITATSPRMLFAIGKHRIGVSAQMPNGEKSPPRDCKVIIEIKADNPSSPASPRASH